MNDTDGIPGPETPQGATNPGVRVGAEARGPHTDAEAVAALADLIHAAITDAGADCPDLPDTHADDRGVCWTVAEAVHRSALAERDAEIERLTSDLMAHVARAERVEDELTLIHETGLGLGLKPAPRVRLDAAAVLDRLRFVLGAERDTEITRLRELVRASLEVQRCWRDRTLTADYPRADARIGLDLERALVEHRHVLRALTPTEEDDTDGR